jgi:hypothetical protein
MTFCFHATIALISVLDAMLIKAEKYFDHEIKNYPTNNLEAY